MIKEVTILGRGPSRIGLQPLGEIWAMNDLYKFQPDIDRLFLLHNLEYHTGREDIDCKSGGDIEEIKKLNIERLIGPLLCEEHGIEAYPMQTIMEHFEVKQYYTDSVDYMMAMAIYEKYETINLHGIDYLPADVVHADSKESTIFWIGVAVGRGITVNIPPLSTLCKLKTYQSGNYMFDTFAEGAPEKYLYVNGQKVLNPKQTFSQPIAVVDAVGNIKAILKDKSVQRDATYY